MDEITQKNIVLVCTCLIVISFHLAYKFKNNIKFCNILLGIGFFISLIITKVLHSWEKENKVDYNLLLFLYILVDIILFLFVIYRWCDIKRKMTGGGDKLNLIDEFRKQDFMINGIAESPMIGIIGEKIKTKITDYIIGIISKFNI